MKNSEIDLKKWSDRRDELLSEMRDLNDAGRILVNLMDLILAERETDFQAFSTAFGFITHAHNHTINRWSSVNRMLMDVGGVYLSVHTESERCPSCGRYWFPSMESSDSFPGSMCDIGECLCAACENDADCFFHGRVGAQFYEE